MRLTNRVISEIFRTTQNSKFYREDAKDAKKIRERDQAFTQMKRSEFAT